MNCELFRNILAGHINPHSFLEEKCTNQIHLKWKKKLIKKMGDLTGQRIAHPQQYNVQSRKIVLVKSKNVS